MSNVLEYILSLKDDISGKLQKIGIANDQQLATWGRVQQKVASANATMSNMGVTVGSLRERVAALRAEKEWIPANNINAIRRSNLEIKSLKRQITKLNNVNGGKLKAWFSNLKSFVPIVDRITNPFFLLGSAIRKTGSYVKESQSVWQQEAESQTKLATVMRNTMNAGQDQVNTILELASAQQKLGVVGDKVQLAGSQELATYLSKTDSLKRLMPVMNDMLAQQYGLNATQEQAVTIASMMGKVMDGQVGALSRYGYKFTQAQEKILKYGTESERVATLADVVTSAVGGVNEALASTPEGKLKQQANNMGDLQERVGKLYTEIKASLIPLIYTLGETLDCVIVWFENNRDAIIGTIGAIATAVQNIFSSIGSVIEGIVSSFGWWFDKLREGDIPIVIITGVIGSLAAAIAVLTLETKAMALWSGIITTAKWAWAAAQNALNLSMLANPTTWIIAGIVALIAVIAYLCYKIDGWRSLWDGVVGFMKYSFMAYVDSVKLDFTTLVNGIMTGLDMIKLGWYKFKEACGLGDSSENQAAIAKINADVEQRQQAIVDGTKKVLDNANKARESLAGIKMSWNSDRSLSDITKGLKEKLGMGGEVNDQMVAANTGGLEGAGSGGGTGAANAIATGGTRNTQITINLGKMVENIIFQGGISENSQDVTRQVEEALVRVLYAAQSAG